MHPLDAKIRFLSIPKIVRDSYIFPDDLSELNKAFGKKNLKSDG